MLYTRLQQVRSIFLAEGASLADRIPPAAFSIDVLKAGRSGSVSFVRGSFDSPLNCFAPGLLPEKSRVAQ